MFSAKIDCTQSLALVMRSGPNYDISSYRILWDEIPRVKLFIFFNIIFIFIYVIPQKQVGCP